MFWYIEAELKLITKEKSVSVLLLFYAEKRAYFMSKIITKLLRNIY